MNQPERRRRDRLVRRLRQRTQRGASAVEFALVSFVMFPLLFGIIEYGLWFNDSLNVRQGVREAARVGVVQNFGQAGCATGNDMEKLACRTKKFVGAATGDTHVKIMAPGGWEKTEPLVVCAMVRSKVIGLAPLPNDRMIRSRTEMSIEVDEDIPAVTAYTDTALPSGADWGWCT